VNGFYLRFAVAWLMSVGVGCSSAPIRFYTLTPTSDKTLLSSPAPLPMDVRVLHIPPQLDRAELVVRTGTTDVTLLDNERWASPVKDEVKQALWLELQRRLGRMTGVRLAVTRLTLDVDVQRLEAELGQYALFEASWTATLSATESASNVARVISCAFQADEKIDAGYAEMVRGYQRAIAALADAIVGVLTSPAGSIETPCQKSIDH
jgi:uncharacterized lipoprotein YmbA